MEISTILFIVSVCLIVILYACNKSTKKVIISINGFSKILNVTKSQSSKIGVVVFDDRVIELRDDGKTNLVGVTWTKHSGWH